MGKRGIQTILDPERRANYLKCWGLNKKWVKDIEELEHLYRYNEEGEDIDDLSKLINSVHGVRSAYLQTYINKYAKYPIGFGFQVIAKNRRIGLCHVESVNIVSESKLGGALSPEYDKRSDCIVLEEDEFYYSLRVPTWNTGLSRTFKVIPTPKRMYHMCPICDTISKPLIDVTIGGEEEVSCLDCYEILNAMFGVRYVKNELKFNTIRDLSVYNVICETSQKK